MRHLGANNCLHGSFSFPTRLALFVLALCVSGFGRVVFQSSAATLADPSKKIPKPVPGHPRFQSPIPELIPQTGHISAPRELVFSPDSRLLASIGYDDTIKVWEVPDGHLVRTIPIPHLTPRSEIRLAISTDDRWLATSVSPNQDGDIAVWDLSNGLKVYELDGEESYVRYLAFNSAGNRLVSINNNGFRPCEQTETDGCSSALIVKNWDLKNGRSVTSFRSRDSRLWPVGMSPDARWVLMKIGQNLALMDVSIGRMKAGLVGARPGAAFSPDGSLLASATEDSKVKIWECATGKDVVTLDESNALLGWTVSSSGRLILAARADQTINFWDIAKAQENGGDDFLTSRPAPRWDARFTQTMVSPVGVWMANAGDLAFLTIVPNPYVDISSMEKFKLWNVGSDSAPRILEGWTEPVAFSPDGHWFASGGARGIRLLDLKTGQEQCKWVAATNSVRAVAISSNGLWLASGDDGGLIQLWELRKGLRRFTLAQKVAWAGLLHPGAVSGLAFDPQVRLLASGSDLLVSEDSVSTMAPLMLHPLSEAPVSTAPVPVPSVCGAPPKTPSPIFASQGKLTVWKLPPASRIFMAEDNASAPVAFSPLGLLAASDCRSTGYDCTARIWNGVAGGSEAPFSRGSEIVSLAFSPESDRKLIALVTRTSEIKLFNLSNGIEGPTFEGDAAAFSPDGRTLAFATTEKKSTSSHLPVLKLWDVRNGQSRTLARQTSSPTIVERPFSLGSGIVAMAFDPNGRWLVAAEGKTLRRWEMATRKELPPLKGHTGNITSIAFSSNEVAPWLATASDDGTVRVWNSDTGDQLASLVSLRGNTDDWLVATPDGLFDGSQGAWSQILWHFGHTAFDVAPIEIFFNEFFRPGLLTQIVGGKPQKAPTSIADRDRRQPNLRVYLPGQEDPENISSRNLRVQIEATEQPPDKDHSQGAGVEEVRLFRNGSLVKAWHGPAHLDQRGKAVFESTIQIVAGENRLSAYCFNKDHIKSKDTVLTLMGSDLLKRKGTANVVAIGLTHYSNDDFNLAYPASDAQTFAHVLQQQQRKLNSYKRVVVVPMPNEKATRVNILAALAGLAGTTMDPVALDSLPELEQIKPALPEDVIFIYFSGHGVTQGSEFHLIPYDMEYRGRRGSIDSVGINTLLAHSISTTDLSTSLESIDAGHIVLVIDACYSGQALEVGPDSQGPAYSKGLAQLAYGKGIYVLAAAQSYQRALEPGNYGQGLLTHVLIQEELIDRKGISLREGSQLTVREWLDYAGTRVPEILEDEFGLGENVQQPVVFHRRDEEVLPFVVANF